MTFFHCGGVSSRELKAKMMTLDNPRMKLYLNFPLKIKSTNSPKLYRKALLAI
jgi:hypothetical protein